MFHWPLGYYCYQSGNQNFGKKRKQKHDDLVDDQHCTYLEHFIRQSLDPGECPVRGHLDVDVVLEFGGSPDVQRGRCCGGRRGDPPHRLHHGLQPAPRTLAVVISWN